MFFEKYPIRTFLIGGSESILVRDFLRAIKLDPLLSEESSYYTVYRAKDNETPEIISHKVYGSTQYHWIIMLLNQKFNPYDDFPKSDDIVCRDTIRRYGSLTGIHHYVDANNEITDEFTLDKVPVTFYEYMVGENENKRQTKILKKELIAEFSQVYQGLINNG